MAAELLQYHRCSPATGRRQASKIEIAVAKEGRHMGMIRAKGRSPLGLAILAATFLVPGVLRANQVAPTITTIPGGTVIIGSGSLLTDSATLAGGFNPTGTITFTLQSPSTAIVDTETVSVSGNGTYTTPVGDIPIATGTYQWRAAYSGDTSNLSASSTLGAEPESVVSATPEPSTLWLLLSGLLAVVLIPLLRAK
jgi:hypothetical protein